MKTQVILVLLALLGSSVCFSQEPLTSSDSDSLVKVQYRPTPRRKFINLSYTASTLKQEGLGELKSKYGGAFTVGRTFFLHRKPIGGVLRFGLDATWFDLNYTNYENEQLPSEYGSHQWHEAEISMHIGPSINVNPVGKLNINAYYRFAPTFSCIYDTNNESLIGNYASFFVGGVAISYGAIGFGIEARMGDCKYRALRGLEEEIDKYRDLLGLEEDIKREKTESFSLSSKFKHSGFRAYITFRFGAKK